MKTSLVKKVRWVSIVESQGFFICKDGRRPISDTLFTSQESAVQFAEQYVNKILNGLTSTLVGGI